MNASSAMLARKTTWVLLILLAALSVWIPQQRRLAQARIALTDAKAQRVKFDQRIATATAALESVRRELRARQSNRAETQAAVAKAEEELARVDPESLWLAPPLALPDWNAASPYVWLRKDLLPDLDVSAFTDNGELRGEVATVLAASETQLNALNTALLRLLADYRAVEVANAERIEESLPGINGDDSKVTVQFKPMPEEGERMKQRFEAALRSELGEQRANLLMRLSEGWFHDQFSFFAAKPPTITVSRHPNGKYDISIKSGDNKSFIGPTTIDEIRDNIPLHLRLLFSDVLSEAAPAIPAAVSAHEK